MTTAAKRRAITHEIAAYAAASHYAALPENIRIETKRAFLNWVGCALGGSGEALASSAIGAVLMTGGAEQATIIGRRRRTDVASAAFVNCASSSALAYDDTHLATVTHPTGPVAAALLAYAETTPVTGEEFLNALALGIEIECRQSNHEGQLIDWIHEAGREVAAGRMLGVVMNPGAYTHTSVALHDAIKGASVPLVELHISNVHAREEFRHHSYISPAARGIIVGFGVKGYPLAIEALVRVSGAK
jgi:3-dehydroquinate dehydratase-2